MLNSQKACICLYKNQIWAILLLENGQQKGSDLIVSEKIARLTTVAKSKNFLTRIWNSHIVGIR